MVYAQDLTRNAAKPDPRLFEALREVGFDDAAILVAAEITAYFNFVNRLATSLGVELEDQQRLSQSH